MNTACNFLDQNYPGEEEKKSNLESPLISIITVVYNGEKYLEQTIKSVISQTYRNINYIIIDGASSDGTYAIIKKYEDKLTFWLSEPDNGIYHAMNKGIEIVKDEDSYILFINSDDYIYQDTTIEKIVPFFSNSDFVYGKIMYLGNSKSIVLGEDLSVGDLPFNMIQHQASFVKRKLYSKLGAFNTSYRIAADFDFAVRQMKSDFSRKFVNEIVAVMRTGGTGSVNFKDTIKEKSKIIYNHFEGSLRIRSLIFFNLYELPKAFIYNLVSRLGILKILKFIKMKT